MKTKPVVRISGMILLAVVVSLVMLLLVYTLQHPQLMIALATVSWNR